jgi:hypothetical protein
MDEESASEGGRYTTLQKHVGLGIQVGVLQGLGALLSQGDAALSEG